MTGPPNAVHCGPSTGCGLVAVQILHMPGPLEVVKGVFAWRPEGAQEDSRECLQGGLVCTREGILRYCLDGFTGEQCQPNV